MPLIAEPSRENYDVLICLDEQDVNEALELRPELASISIRFGHIAESRFLEGMRMGNVYFTRRAFMEFNYKGNYRLWRTILTNQLLTGKDGKIIIL